MSCPLRVILHLPASLVEKTGLVSLVDAPAVQRDQSSKAEARANPPPRRKITPQHILVSISLQVMRLGEFWRLRFIGANGQNS